MKSHASGAALLLASATIAWSCTPPPGPAPPVCAPAPASAPVPSSQPFASPSAVASGAEQYTIVRHPRPARQRMDIAPFIKAGCVDEYSTLDCSRSKEIQKLGCDRDRLEVVQELAALTPSIAGCWQPGGTALLTQRGCRLTAVRKLVVAAGGAFTLIQTRKDLVALVGPIDSPEEALALLMASTNAEPNYLGAVQPGDHLHTDRLETSFAEPAPGGFHVHARVDRNCGCGPHPTYAVDATVSSTGDVKETKRTLIFDDGDPACFD